MHRSSNTLATFCIHRQHALDPAKIPIACARHEHDAAGCKSKLCKVCIGMFVRLWCHGCTWEDASDFMAYVQSLK